MQRRVTPPRRLTAVALAATVLLGSLADSGARRSAASGPDITAFDLAINGGGSPAGAVGTPVATTLVLSIDAAGAAASTAGMPDFIRTVSGGMEMQTGPNNTPGSTLSSMPSSAVGAGAGTISVGAQSNVDFSLGSANIPTSGPFAGYVPNCGDNYGGVATRDYNNDGLLNGFDNMVTVSVTGTRIVSNMAHEVSPLTPTGLFASSAPAFVPSEYGTDASPGDPNTRFVQTYDDDNNNGVPDYTEGGGPDEPAGPFTGFVHPLATGAGGSEYVTRGVPQTQEDYDDDGIPNGAEYMPDFLPVMVDALGLRPYWESRTYGILDFMTGLTPPEDLHVIGFADVPGIGGLTVSVLGNSFAPPNPALQAYAVCTPLTSTSTVQSTTNVVSLCAGTGRSGCPAPPGVTSGDAVQRVTTTGAQVVQMFVSDADNYDADFMVAPSDLCARSSATNSDPDNDLTAGICDPAAASADNDSDGNSTVTDRDTSVPISGASCGGNGICDNDTDNDGWINNVDNCETTANAAQTDDDGDGVGDACDLFVTFDSISGFPSGKGSGTNNSAVYDNDSLCDDSYNTAFTESLGDGVPAGACTNVQDASDDGEPDATDTNSDEDGDNFSDSLEIGFATNPLNPSSFPPCVVNPLGTPTGTDTDADHLLDSCEAGAGTIVGNPDTDGDGVKDGMEVGIGTNPNGGSGYLLSDTDGDGCTDANEKTTNPNIGGRRHPGNYWDFYDINGSGDIDLGDTLALLMHFGHGFGDDASDQRMDRALKLSGGAPGFLAEGNDGVDLADAVFSLAQFGASCTPPGPTPAPGGGVYS